MRTGSRRGVLVCNVCAEDGVFNSCLVLNEIPVYEAEHVRRVPVGLLVEDKRTWHVPIYVSLRSRDSKGETNLTSPLTRARTTGTLSQGSPPYAPRQDTTSAPSQPASRTARATLRLLSPSPPPSAACP